jgi:hypothetical protein
VTGVPYGSGGVMFGLRADHDEGDCLCSRSPRRAEYWQRGDPMTGLPVAPVWRPRAATEVAVDPMVRVRSAVGEAHQRLAAHGRQAAEWGQVRQVARWLAEDQAAGGSRREGVERGAPDLAAGGAA